MPPDAMPPDAMALNGGEVTAEEIRRVEFRERLRGYNQGDVDEFLERVAGAVERLHERLRQAGVTPVVPRPVPAGDDGPVERVVVRPAPSKLPPPAPTEAVPTTLPPGAVAPPAAMPERPGPGSDESLRRTLELAQRAADMAVQEARQEGAAILGEAEARAAEVVAAAEERARDLADQAQAELRAEVDRLEARSTALQAEVGALVALMDRERFRARTWLSQVGAAVEGQVAPPVSATAAGDDMAAAGGDDLSGAA
ncbi:MAG: DivIVA domain-containing protein, partial [Acidimicrobiales bacterium]